MNDLVRSGLFELWRDRPRDVEQREQLCAREQVGQRLERLLAPAHPGQPVVDERDSGAVQVGRYNRRLRRVHAVVRSASVISPRPPPPGRSGAPV